MANRLADFVQAVAPEARDNNNDNSDNDDNDDADALATRVAGIFREREMAELIALYQKLEAFQKERMRFITVEWAVPAEEPTLRPRDAANRLEPHVSFRVDVLSPDLDDEVNVRAPIRMVRHPGIEQMIATVWSIQFQTFLMSEVRYGSFFSVAASEMQLSIKPNNAEVLQVEEEEGIFGNQQRQYQFDGVNLVACVPEEGINFVGYVPVDDLTTEQYSRISGMSVDEIHAALDGFDVEQRGLPTGLNTERRVESAEALQEVLGDEFEYHVCIIQCNVGSIRNKCRLPL